jgi:hypothetical protein
MSDLVPGIREFEAAVEAGKGKARLLLKCRDVNLNVRCRQ